MMSPPALLALTSLAIAGVQFAAGGEEIPSAPKPGTIWTNSVGMELVAIPAGRFKMGASASAEERNSRTAPVREVEVAKPFWMGVYEVSQKQWHAIMGTTIEEQHRLEFGPDYNPPFFDGSTAIRARGDLFPMAFVNWTEAKEFCLRLTGRERKAGRLPVTLSYALPAEAQWEYACRAGTLTRFWFGDVKWFAEPLRIDGKVIPPFKEFEDRGREEDYPFDPTDGRGRLRNRQANPFGLCNMHGGIHEWCRDDDGDGPAGQRKVIRPGGGLQDFGLSEAHERGAAGISDRIAWVGFRVVVVAR